jgi:Rieske Fe-S protein
MSIERAGIDRRTVLATGAVVAAGTLVAACGGSAGDTASSGPAAGGAASGTSPAAGAVAQAADIPVGGGVVLAEQAIVVTQPTEGEFRAFDAICPHQGCLVSEVVDNEIVCPCHGSRFSASDGAVLQGPALEGLQAEGVVVENGSVVLS